MRRIVSRSLRIIACSTLVALVVGVNAGAEDMEMFVSLDKMIIAGPAGPTEAEMLAATAFNRSIETFTGRPLPSMWGAPSIEAPAVTIGTRATHQAMFDELWQGSTAPERDEANQSYLIAAGEGGITVLGAGEARTARGSLGLGYALGELLRLLENRGGQWGFALPPSPICRTPQVSQRTWYYMNNVHNVAEGISLEYWDHPALEDYVDRLIQARYSRLSLYQWMNNYLYPGNFDDIRPYNQMVHRQMRYLFNYARRRGLQIVHQLTPAHVNVSFLPDDPKYWGTGYYGKSSACWAQPEGRELARRMAQHEMEYYGPVDGYIVWFYDPGGCFCDICLPNQAKHLFEQLMLVRDLAETISPGAFFQAVLWPTWAFVPESTIPYENQADVEAMVQEFLALALEQFGPRELAIMDSCEADTTNIYSGSVSPENFLRNAFMYSVLGMAGECGAAFAPFRFQHLDEKLRLVRERGLEESTLFLMFAATNFPTVYAFGDMLYEGVADWQDAIGRYVSTVAKSDEARSAMTELLVATEHMFGAETLEEKEGPLGRMEKAWERLKQTGHFYADSEWLEGYVKAQRHYLKMAEAEDKPSLEKALDAFREDVGAISLYETYMRDKMNEGLVTRLHLPMYWLPPDQRTRMVGWFD